MFLVFFHRINKIMWTEGKCTWCLHFKNHHQLFLSPPVCGCRVTSSGCSTRNRRSSSPATTTERSSTFFSGRPAGSLPPLPPAAKHCGKSRQALHILLSKNLHCRNFAAFSAWDEVMMSVSPWSGGPSWPVSGRCRILEQSLQVQALGHRVLFGCRDGWGVCQLPQFPVSIRHLMPVGGSGCIEPHSVVVFDVWLRFTGESRLWGGDCWAALLGNATFLLSELVALLLLPCSWSILCLSALLSRWWTSLPLISRYFHLYLMGGTCQKTPILFPVYNSPFIHFCL